MFSLCFLVAGTSSPYVCISLVSEYVLKDRFTSVSLLLKSSDMSKVYLNCLHYTNYTPSTTGVGDSYFLFRINWEKFENFQNWYECTHVKQHQT